LRQKRATLLTPSYLRRCVLKTIDTRYVIGYSL
jgi:hypothetical protein